MTAHSFRLRLGGLALITALGAAATSAHSAIVLTVDARDTSRVVITATDGLSLASSEGVGYGILLEGALGAPSRFASFSTLRNLGPAQSPGTLYNVASAQGLALSFNAGGAATSVFVEGQTAFSGSSTFDLSSLPFRTTDFVGNIVVRDDFARNLGIVIGQFSIDVADAVATVPEPSTLMLAGLALGAVALRRKA